MPSYTPTMFEHDGQRYEAISPKQVITCCCGMKKAYVGGSQRVSAFDVEKAGRRLGLIIQYNGGYRLHNCPGPWRA